MELQFLAQQQISQAVLVLLSVLSVSLLLSFACLIIMTERKDYDEKRWLFGFIGNGVVTMLSFAIVRALTAREVTSEDITKETLDVLYVQVMMLYGFVAVYVVSVLAFIWRAYATRVTASMNKGKKKHS